MKTSLLTHRTKQYRESTKGYWTGIDFVILTGIDFVILTGFDFSILTGIDFVILKFYYSYHRSIFESKKLFWYFWYNNGHKNHILYQDMKTVPVKNMSRRVAFLKYEVFFIPRIRFLDIEAIK